MSVYNGSDYLYDQMESIKNQSLQADEVIFLDDCSTDNSVLIIQDYIKKNRLSHSWKVIVNAHNKGWKQNFIEGIEYTDGEIVFFSDQDDFWLPQKIEKYISVFQNTEVNVIISPYIEWFGDDITVPSMTAQYNMVRLDGSFSNFNITGSGCTQAFRKSYYDRISKYYVQGWAHDDYFRKIPQIDGSLALMESASILRRFHGKNESKKKRTYESSLSDYEVGIKYIDQMKKYIDDLQNEKIEAQNTKFLNKIRRGYVNRSLYFKTNKFKYLFLTVILNREQYDRLRQIPGDFLLVSKHNKTQEGKIHNESTYLR